MKEGSLFFELGKNIHWLSFLNLREIFMGTKTPKGQLGSETRQNNVSVSCTVQPPKYNRHSNDLFTTIPSTATTLQVRSDSPHPIGLHRAQLKAVWREFLYN